VPAASTLYAPALPGPVPMTTNSPSGPETGGTLEPIEELAVSEEA